jgi:multisubunit Na+/H+ antiporter MnhB subunit
LADEAVGARGSALKYQLAFSGVVLSALSFALVLCSASEEPFFSFRCSELALNVVLAGLVFVLFASWAVACLLYFRSEPGRGWLARLLVGACVLWSAINLFYLGTSIYGYRQDLRNPRLHRER